MHDNTHVHSRNPGGLPLMDFGELQSRYQSMALAMRAQAVLKDAAPAIRAAEEMLAALAAHPKTKHTFENLRKNQMVMGRMRPSEAKNMLVDSGSDFVDITRKKLAAWQKTMNRLAHGEGIIIERSGEYISSQVPLAGALASVSTLTSYLSIVQIAVGELAKIDSKNALHHHSVLAKIRRCATLLCDCETAASFTAMVH